MLPVYKVSVMIFSHVHVQFTIDNIRPVRTFDPVKHKLNCFLNIHNKCLSIKYLKISIRFISFVTFQNNLKKKHEISFVQL